MDEKRAIQLLKQGDISGLEFLVHCHQVRAVRAAYLITLDAELAEEIVQEAFLRTFWAIRTFDSSRPFEPWFLRSVINASVKVMKRLTRQLRVSDEEDTFLLDFTQETDSVEAQVESIEIQDRVWEAMQKLSPRQRAVIVQRYFLEMTEKEMAAESGAAVGTIKWLLSAARQRLRYLLAERSEE